MNVLWRSVNNIEKPLIADEKVQISIKEAKELMPVFLKGIEIETFNFQPSTFNFLRNKPARMTRVGRGIRNKHPIRQYAIPGCAGTIILLYFQFRYHAQANRLLQ